MKNISTLQPQVTEDAVIIINILLSGKNGGLWGLKCLVVAESSVNAKCLV